MKTVEQIQQERQERFDREEIKQTKEILRNYLSKNEIKIVEENFQMWDGAVENEYKEFRCKTINGTYRIQNVIGRRNRGIHMKSYFAMYKEENGKSKRISKKEW